MAATKVDIDKVVELLGCGLNHEQAAQAVGCDTSYITHLLSDETIRNKVVAVRSTALSANNDRDRKIDSLEDRVLAKIEESLDLIYKPSDLLAAFTVLNRAQRRGYHTPSGASQAVTQIVNLQIPQQVFKHFTLSDSGEVIDIEGQTMVSMPAQALLSDLQKENPNDDKYKKAANYIPDQTVYLHAKIANSEHIRGKRDSKGLRYAADDEDGTAKL